MKRFLDRHRRLLALFVVVALVLSVIRPEALPWVSAANADDAVAGVEEVDEAGDGKGNASGDLSADTADGKQEESPGAAKTLSVYVPESGCTITIQAPEGSLPYPKEELSVAAHELLPGTEEYENYYSASMEALKIEASDQEGSEGVSFARFFDVEILRNGEKVEPESAVVVKIEYDDAPEIPDGAELSVVHFAEEGTEVIEDVEVSDDATEIVYEQESFSVVATVVTPAPAVSDRDGGLPYALVAKIGNEVYMVTSNGSLTPVKEYTTGAGGGIDKITSDYVMFWRYLKLNDKSYIRYKAEGYDFGDDKQARTFSYAYLNPNDPAGYTTETPKTDEHGNIITAYDENDHFDRTQFISPVGECSIEFESNRIKLAGGDKYIGVSDGKLVGNCSASDVSVTGVEFFLAKADSVPSDAYSWDYNRLHIVDHIDISIEDEVETIVPLAYGTYYDAEGNELFTIDKNSSDADKNIRVKKRVGVDAEHLKKATIRAMYRGREIDDAYFITGYSANSETGISTAQVRIEGIYKVAILDRFNGRKYIDDNFDNGPTDEYKKVWEERIKPENQVRYEVTAVQPNVEFEYIHPTYGQLYDSKHHKLTIEGDVSITADFGYWDEEIRDVDGNVLVPGNECPPIQPGFWGTNRFYNDWKQGEIWNNGGSGMDFKLLGESTVTLDPVAIEVTKQIVDEDGNPILPSEDLNGFKFDIHQNAGASANDVEDLDVGTYTTPADYSGYVLTDDVTVDVSKDTGDGIEHRHQAQQGMIYISEDKSTIPNQFTDSQGRIWVFKETYFKTEYAWRKEGDSGKKHISKTYARDDTDEFASIPEVLGSYGEPDQNGNKLFNSFLEFDAYNVYEQPKFEKKEISPYVGTGTLGGVKVGDEITYEINYKNYKDVAADIVISDKLDDKVEFVDKNDGSVYDATEHTVTWTLPGVEPGTAGTVLLTVKVLPGALESQSGPGKVVNGGDTASVKVGNDPKFTLNTVENPVPEKPEKQEITPYVGKGVLGAVKVGDEITYEISYKNYKDAAADIAISDKLDANVEYVSASGSGAYDADTHTVSWTLADVAAGNDGTVTLTVKVLEGALESKRGSGKVVNGGDTTTVKVGNDNAYNLNTVENPVPENPEKQEITPYVGKGVLGAVKAGDEITYTISYKNYKNSEADIVIKDKLDANVEYVDKQDGSAYDASDRTVTWRLTRVAAGAKGTVSLTVKVLASALESQGGPGKVVNGGDTATVKVGNDPEYTLNTVENPVP